MRKENRKKSLRGNKRAVAPVIGEIIMIVITVGLAALVATYAYGYGGLLEQKPMPAFSVSREDDNTVSVVLHDKGGAGKIEGLMVQSPNVKDTSELNDIEPTGEIEIGDTLKTEGVKAGDHYVVNATVDGTNRVVIEIRI